MRKCRIYRPLIQCLCYLWRFLCKQLIWWLQMSKPTSSAFHRLKKLWICVMRWWVDLPYQIFKRLLAFFLDLVQAWSRPFLLLLLFLLVGSNCREPQFFSISLPVTSIWHGGMTFIHPNTWFSSAPEWVIWGQGCGGVHLPHGCQQYCQHVWNVTGDDSWAESWIKGLIEEVFSQQVCAFLVKRRQRGPFDGWW